MEFINLNGKILRKDEAVIKIDNSSYRYGDGLFETMKIVDGKIFLEKYHFERLFHSIELLKFQLPEFFLKEKLIEEVLELCQGNDLRESARVRLSVSRGADEQLNYLIESSPLQLREENLNIDVYPDARKSCDVFSNIKSANRLPYVMAEKFAKENQLDDCLVLNDYGRICDSTISNIFWIKNKKIFTPPLSEGCVAGVMRKFLIEKLRATSFELREKACDISDLQNADEIFLTNAIRGIRTVKKFKEVELQDHFTEKIKWQLNI